MAREIPEVVRAAAGLAATVVDEARKLPETLPGLPVRLIGLAMQQAMKVQQQYAGFVARGDELFTGLRGEHEPGLATFDDDEPPVAPAGFRESAFDRAGDAEPTSASVDLIIDEEAAVDDPAADAMVAAAVEDLTAEDLGEQIDEAQRSLDVLAEQAPDTETILDEIAIDEHIDQAPTLTETAPAAPAAPRTGRKPAKGSAKAAKAAEKAAGRAAEKPAKATKSTKPRKAAKAAPPAAATVGEDAAVTEDAATLETALLEAAIAAPGAPDTADTPAAAEPTPADTVDAEPSVDAADTPAAAEPTPADTVDAEPSVDVATTVDVLTPDGGIAPVDAAVTDEGVAAPESPADAEPAPPADAPPAGNGAATATDESGTPVAAATGVRTDVEPIDTTTDDSAIAEGSAVDAVGETSAAPTDDPQGGSDLSGSQAAGTAPVDGYDGFSIAQLRGRLRGYQPTTVRDLIAYEEATRARSPYLKMLRNRLERVATETS
jgi:hypothetical protein